MGHHDGQPPVRSNRSTKIPVTSLEELRRRAGIDGLNLRYFQLQSAGFRGSYAAIALPGLRIVEETLLRSLHVAGNGPAGAACIIVPLEIKSFLRHRGRTVSEGECIGVAPGQPLDLVVGPETKLVRIQVSVDLHGRICQAITGRGAPCGAIGNKVWQIEPLAYARLKQCLLEVLSRRWMRSEPTDEGQGAESEAAGLSRELIWTLSSCAAKPQDLAKIGGTGWPLYARSARAFMEANCRRPLALEELCVETGVSLRTLHYAFRDYFGIPPGRYHKQRRLMGAREEMTGEDLANASVTDIATNWGFWHFGRFSADYKALFGEPPSQTLARQRNRRTALAARKFASGAALRAASGR